MHYTSFLNNLSSHLSIFPPLPPSVSASPFFCLALSASPLRYLSAWATSLSPSHSPILILTSIFLHLFFSYPPSLSFCPATFLSVPSIPLPSPSSRLEIKPRWRERGPTTSPAEPQPHGPEKTDLEQRDKVHQNCTGFTAPWPAYIFGCHFHISYTFPALLHPVCLRLSPPPSPLSSPPQTDVVAVLTVRRVCSD